MINIKLPAYYYSWTILANKIFVKKMDKSTFLHNGTGIPNEIRIFWGVEYIKPGGKEVIFVEYDDEIYEMSLTCDRLNRTRLFWNINFSNIIRDRYWEIYNLYKNNISVDNIPELMFINKSYNFYKVEFVEEIDKIYSSETCFKEGRLIEYYAKKYERDARARKIALEIHGFDCKSCGFNYEKKYGKLGYGFIEIHHIKPLYLNHKEMEVNPKKDLLPVCANCHRMIHRYRHKVYSIEEIREQIKISG